MSEQRFDGIDRRFDAIEAELGVVKADVSVLKTDVAAIKTDVAELKTDVAELKTDVVDLRRHMGVLHEDVIDRIKAIREDDSLRREMRAGFAELRELILNHAIPGDAADRAFAATLQDHEQRIQKLEQQ